MMREDGAIEGGPRRWHLQRGVESALVSVLVSNKQKDSRNIDSKEFVLKDKPEVTREVHETEQGVTSGSHQHVLIFQSKLLSSFLFTESIFEVLNPSYTSVIEVMLNH